MRITTGRYKGRNIIVPPGDRIRPTGDRLRQAIFNILLQYDLPARARVIDGFCGSGALGLEALSRGAAHVTFIDIDTTCCAENIKALGIDKAQARLLKKPAAKPGPVQGPPATLLFLDPPYDQGLLAPALTGLAGNGWLAPGAVCVCETGAARPTGDALPPVNFALEDERRYGAALLRILRFQPD